MKRMHGKVKVLPIHKPRLEGDVEQEQEQAYTGLRECPICSSEDIVRSLVVVGGKPGALQYWTWCQCRMCNHAGPGRLVLDLAGEYGMLGIYQNADKAWNTDPNRLGD